MLSKILVAIDQSKMSQEAFSTALDLAKALGATLTLVHVLSEIDPDAPKHPETLVNSYGVGLSAMIRKTYENQWDEFVTHYDALLRQKEQEAKALGIRASSLQPYGHPGQAICEAASACQADLIIIGSHHRTGIKELLLGSVSNYVMHHAPCSVMVMHSREISYSASKERLVEDQQQQSKFPSPANV